MNNRMKLLGMKPEVPLKLKNFECVLLISELNFLVNFRKSFVIVISIYDKILFLGFLIAV